MGEPAMSEVFDISEAREQIHYWRSEAWALEYCLRKVVEAADEFEKDCGMKHNDKLSEALEWSRDILNAGGQEKGITAKEQSGTATNPSQWHPDPAAPYKCDMCRMIDASKERPKT
jgi:hypothetical protein